MTGDKLARTPSQDIQERAIWSAAQERVPPNTPLAEISRARKENIFLDMGTAEFPQKMIVGGIVNSPYAPPREHLLPFKCEWAFMCLSSAERTSIAFDFQCLFVCLFVCMCARA